MRGVINKTFIVLILFLLLFISSCKNKDNNKQIDISHIKYHPVENRLIPQMVAIDNYTLDDYTYYSDIQSYYFKDHRFKVIEEYGLDFNIETNEMIIRDDYIQLINEGVSDKRINGAEWSNDRMFDLHYYYLFSPSTRKSIEQEDLFWQYVYDKEKEDNIKPIALHEILEYDHDNKLIGYNLFVIHDFYLGSVCYADSVVELIFDYDDNFKIISQEELKEFSKYWHSQIKFHQANYEVIIDDSLKGKVEYIIEDSHNPYSQIPEKKITIKSLEPITVINHASIELYQTNLISYNPYSHQFSEEENPLYIYTEQRSGNFCDGKYIYYILDSDFNQKTREYYNFETHKFKDSIGNFEIYYFALFADEILSFDIQFDIILKLSANFIENESKEHDYGYRIHNNDLSKLLLNNEEFCVLIPSLYQGKYFESICEPGQIINNYDVRSYNLDLMFYYDKSSKELMPLIDAYNNSLLKDNDVDLVISNLINYYN